MSSSSDPRPLPVARPAARSVVVALNCTNCGGGLKITAEMDVFACGYCGSRQMVRREGGVICLKAVGDAIARVQAGTDRTAAELAVRRLREDVADIDSEISLLRRERHSDRRDQGIAAGRLLALIVTVAGVLTAGTATVAGAALAVLTAVVIGGVGGGVVMIEYRRRVSHIDAAFARRFRPLADERDRLRNAIDRHLDTLEDAD